MFLSYRVLYRPHVEVEVTAASQDILKYIYYTVLEHKSRALAIDARGMIMS
jgi:hypothetical protein